MSIASETWAVAMTHLHRWLPCAIALAIVDCAAVDARAELSFCNKTSVPVTVAIAVGQKDRPGVSTGGDLGVSVEGWWEFAPGECAPVSDVNAGGSWLYYYGHSSQGVWDGSSRLCVRSRRFKNDQRFLGSKDGCKGEFRPVGFRRIDANKKNYIMNLTR